MFNYNIDWLYIIRILVPPVYRTTNHLDWLQALLKPVRSLYSAFLTYKSDKMYFASIRFQKIYMEKMLNDLYDNDNRRIYIEDATRLTAVYVANKALGYPPVYVHNSSVTHDPLWVYSKSSYVAQLDFVVKVPVSIYSDLNLDQMKAYINDYKFAGKRYEIQSF